jgi:hypothetical protein
MLVAASKLTGTKAVELLVPAAVEPVAHGLPGVAGMGAVLPSMAKAASNHCVCRVRMPRQIPGE